MAMQFPTIKVKSIEQEVQEVRQEWKNQPKA